MNNLYDALEICLQEIENGAATESVLSRYPDLADELRPILEVSAGARAISVFEPSASATRRNRAKVLQRAAELREAKARPAIRFGWFAPLRKFASTLAILVVVFASGTSLVGAASTSLPGDELYPVKRSWEGLQLFFTFDAKTHEALAVEYENERIEEVRDLFAGNRSADVAFSGSVASQNGTEWLVAGIRVVISPQTDLPTQTLQVASAVRVQGSTQPDGSVLATSIMLLPPGASLPGADDQGNEGESDDEESPDDEGESGSGVEDDAPESAATPAPESDDDDDDDDTGFNGILDILGDDFWTINGIPADVSDSEVVGTPAVNAPVIVEGYFNSDGTFIVTRIEFLDESQDDSNSNDNGAGEENSNDDDNDDPDDPDNPDDPPDDLGDDNDNDNS